MLVNVSSGAVLLPRIKYSIPILALPRQPIGGAFFVLNIKIRLRIVLARLLGPKNGCSPKTLIRDILSYINTSTTQKYAGTFVLNLQNAFEFLTYSE
uniref:Reverse transcriptase domain-containing protein n=1 Tax=Steinernema glaseri TaxID=37863 RepID=A0A1I7ZVX0_9BILA